MINKYFQLKSAPDGGFYVCDLAGEVIKTHLSTPYVSLSKPTASCLCRDLNQVYSENISLGEIFQPEENEYPNKWLRQSIAYSLISTIIENFNGGYFKFKPANIPEFIQWDMVFRLSPQPEKLKYQLPAIQPLKAQLKARWVDLPLNYSRSLQDMKRNKPGFVSKKVIEELVSIQAEFSWMDHVITEILYNFIGYTTIMTPVFWVGGKIDSKAFWEIFHVFFHLQDYPPGTKISRKSTQYVIKRLNNLAVIRQSIKIHDPKLLERFYVD